VLFNWMIDVVVEFFFIPSKVVFVD
jgi:hypothetical protein